jgi:DNA-directed RNA polymerase I subunit RPA43
MTSAFDEVNLSLKVALLPMNSEQPLEAVKSQLNEMLLKYNEQLQGVPLTYSTLKFPEGKEYARILGEYHWLHVDVDTVMLVFKPRVGMVLKGTINQCSDSHISMLVYGMFNASISGDDMKKHFKFNKAENKW